MALRFRTMAALAVTSFLVLGGILAAGAARTAPDRADRPVTAWSPKSTDWPAFHFGNDRNGATTANATMKLAYYKWAIRTGGQVTSSPVVATVDVDYGGHAMSGPKVLVGSSDSRLYCIDGESHTTLWRYQTAGLIFSSPAVGDLAGDGKPEVVFGSDDGRIYCLDCQNGTLAWRYTTRSEVSAPPALADLNGDGRLEVAVGGRDGRFYVLDAGGKPLWTAQATAGIGGIAAAAAVGDVNGDGRPEIVVQAADSNLTCFSGAEGKALWNFSQFYDPVWVAVTSPCIADLNMDGKMEILVLASNESSVSCLDGSTGEPKWEHFFGGGVYRSTPAVGDVDGNGRPEMVLASTETIVCLNGTTGYLQWSRPFALSQGATYLAQESSPALADIDGDGGLEVVVGASDRMVHALNAEDGTPRWTYPVPRPVQSSPAVADIDGDGKAEVVFGCNDGRVYAVDYNF